MATLAVDSPRVFETGHDDFDNELPVIASDIIYDGAAVGELNDTGTFQPLASGDKFGGFANTKIDNSAGAASAVRVSVKQRGRVKLSVTGVASAADVGKAVYATDDDTFTLTVGGSLIGRIVRWETSTICVVEFEAFHLRNETVVATFQGQTTETAGDRAFFTATRPFYIQAVSEVHGVAAGGASALQVTKDTSTNAPGAGTDLLTNNTNTGFDLNATANTVQVGTIVGTAGVRKLAVGDRLSLDFANTIQSTAGLQVTVELKPL
jgi:hypothetical protein